MPENLFVLWAFQLLIISLLRTLQMAKNVYLIRKTYLYKSQPGKYSAQSKQIFWAHFLLIQKFCLLEISPFLIKFQEHISVLKDIFVLNAFI